MNSYTTILLRLRESRKLKQSDIAGLIGTTQQQYSKYEKGESELPLYALTVLADYYKVSADYIIGRTNCRDGVDGINRKVDAGYTAGEVISDILSLNASGRAAVIEYISLQKMKQACAMKKEKDSPR